MLVLSALASWKAIQTRQQLIEESLNKTYLSADAYAQAAERWLVNDDMETLLRVSNLMLTGGTRFIKITGENHTILELKAADMPGEMSLPATSVRADEPVSTLLQTSMGWMIEIVILLERSSIDAQEVRVWLDAEPLHMNITASTLWLLAISSSCWIILVGGIFIQNRLKSARSGEVASDPGSSPWIVDSAGKRVRLHDRPIPLTPKQYALLTFLVSEGARVISEEEILEAVWPRSPYADSNDIRQCVYKIRKRVALVEPGAEACIINEKGFGYRFEPSELPTHCLETSSERTASAMTEPSERRNQ